MTTANDDFGALLRRARAGDQSALTHLATQYEPEVRIVARVLLGRALRPYLDSLDLVQSVHKSLLLGLRQNKFDISSPEKLVALALTVVRRKVARHWRHLQRQQRLDEGVRLADGRSPVLAAIASPEPDPARDAQMLDTVHQIWAVLDASEKRIMDLRMQGHTTAEVARILDLDPDVLRVRLSRLRRRLRTSAAFSEWL